MVGPCGLEPQTHCELSPYVTLLCLRHFDEMFS